MVVRDARHSVGRDDDGKNFETHQEKNKVESPRTIVNPVSGEKLTFLKTAAETGGEITLCELEVFPHAQGTSEVPLHYHLSYAETFRVLEGELTVQTSEKTMRLKPGESATIPLMTPHAFRNESPQPVKAMFEVTPGSKGLEQGLCILYGLAADGKTNENGMPKSITHMALGMTMSEVRLTGMLSFVFPIMNLIAKVARKRGVERELIDTYCHVLNAG